jgi:phospholipase/lecithinase/hemolysin
MDISEFWEHGRVAFITGNVQEALAAKQALEKVVKSANSLQQLKAEIAAIADQLAIDVTNLKPINSQFYIQWLRQLLAI